MPQFSVIYSFSGSAFRIINAATKEAAEEQVAAEVDSDDFEIEPDEIDSVDYRITEMHPVTREGREIWTTRILPDDTRGHASAIKTTPLFGSAL